MTEGASGADSRRDEAIVVHADVRTDPQDVLVPVHIPHALHHLGQLTLADLSSWSGSKHSR